MRGEIVRVVTRWFHEVVSWWLHGNVVTRPCSRYLLLDHLAEHREFGRYALAADGRVTALRNRRGALVTTAFRLWQVRGCNHHIGGGCNGRNGRDGRLLAQRRRDGLELCHNRKGVVTHTQGYVSKGGYT